MRSVLDWKKYILDGGASDELTALYGADRPAKTARLIALLDTFEARYGADRPVAIFSVPGRSELSGNHTDHNHGRVIAGSIDLDVIAVASPREDGVMRVASEGFDEWTVTPDQTSEPDERLYGTSSSLAAGMANGFAANGYAIGGFDAVMTSTVRGGSGLSSSAAVEVLL